MQFEYETVRSQQACISDALAESQQIYLLFKENHKGQQLSDDSIDRGIVIEIHKKLSKQLFSYLPLKDNW